ncbi:MAG: hypothetical protein H0U52_17830 [Chloroflexi bacterium]|nr:hypothetical protein [Chloroflexota bacterium]
MAIIFIPVVIATVALILIHRQTRLRGADLPRAAAIGTGMILGLATVYLGLAVIGLALGILG